MQSYDIENENKNITLIDETNIYSPLHIKNIIKETYKLNNLQAIYDARPKFLVRPKNGPTMLKSGSSWNLVPLPASSTERG
jgi:hypothetical protein